MAFCESLPQDRRDQKAFRKAPPDLMAPIDILHWTEANGPIYSRSVATPARG